jgi:hypothetical protein
LEFKPEQLRPERAVGPKSATDYYERCQAFAKKFKYNVTPGSLHNITSMTRNMLILQLHRSGILPIDKWTAAEMFGVGNYGKPPDGADTVDERVKRQQEDDLKFAMALKQAVQPANPIEELMQDPQAGPLIMKLIESRQQGGMAGGATGGGGGNPGVGRDPSGQQPPRMVIKGDGRTTVSESGR